MYFGGINGITTFHPEQIADNPYTPPVTITRLRMVRCVLFKLFFSFIKTPDAVPGTYPEYAVVCFMYTVDKA